MVEKREKQPGVSYAIAGRFDTKAAFGLSEKLELETAGKSVAELMLDFSSATHITADGMAALKELGEQMKGEGKKLIIGGMRTEMYKALKIAGISDTMIFSHRSSSQAPF